MNRIQWAKTDLATVVYAADAGPFRLLVAVVHHEQPTLPPMEVVAWVLNESSILAETRVIDGEESAAIAEAKSWCERWILEETETLVELVDGDSSRGRGLSPAAPYRSLAVAVSKLVRARVGNQGAGRLVYRDRFGAKGWAVVLASVCFLLALGLFNVGVSGSLYGVFALSAAVSAIGVGVLFKTLPRS